MEVSVYTMAITECRKYFSRRIINTSSDLGARLAEGPCLALRPHAPSSSFAASCSFKAGGKEHLQPLRACFIRADVGWGLVFSHL